MFGYTVIYDTHFLFFRKYLNLLQLKQIMRLVSLPRTASTSPRRYLIVQLIKSPESFSHFSSPSFAFAISFTIADSVKKWIFRKHNVKKLM